MSKLWKAKRQMEAPTTSTYTYNQMHVIKQQTEGNNDSPQAKKDGKPLSMLHRLQSLSPILSENACKNMKTLVCSLIISLRHQECTAVRLRIEYT